MARPQRSQLIPTGLVWFALAALVWGQPPIPPGPPPPLEERGEMGDRGRRPQRDGDREQFRENLDRWKKMSPDDREAMRQLHDRRRMEMRRDISLAIERSGLKLDEERKEQFVQRYREERRQLEDQIRKEMEAIRSKRLEAIIAKLRAEFAEAKSEAQAEAKTTAPLVPLVEPSP